MMKQTGRSERHCSDEFEPASMADVISAESEINRKQISYANNEVHVWTMSLHADDDTRAHLWTSLSQKERNKAASFRHPEAGRKYIVGRGNLRRILSKYISVDPGKILISESPHGKPYLPESHYKFNLSHSGDLCTYAVSGCCEVGVDVEHVSPAVCSADIARYVFSPKEAGAFERVPPGRKNRLFYLCWVAKEAYTKGLGLGLLIPFPSFTPPMSSSSARLSLWPPDDTREQGWLIRHLKMRRDYVAALAMKTRNRIVIRNFTDVNI